MANLAIYIFIFSSVFLVAGVFAYILEIRKGVKK